MLIEKDVLAKSHIVSFIVGPIEFSKIRKMRICEKKAKFGYKIALNRYRYVNEYILNVFAICDAICFLRDLV